MQISQRTANLRRVEIPEIQYITRAYRRYPVPQLFTVDQTIELHDRNVRLISGYGMNQRNPRVELHRSAQSFPAEIKSSQRIAVHCRRPALARQPDAERAETRHNRLTVHSAIFYDGSSAVAKQPQIQICKKGVHPPGKLLSKSAHRLDCGDAARGADVEEG